MIESLIWSAILMAMALAVVGLIRGFVHLSEKLRWSTPATLIVFFIVFVWPLMTVMIYLKEYAK